MTMSSNSRGRALAAGLALAVIAARAPDMDHPAWAKPFAGSWTLSGVSEGDPVCGLRLRPDAVIGGAGIDLSATCRRNYPFEDVAGWRLQGGSVVLIDAERHVLFTFDRGPDGNYSAMLPGDKGVSLERGAPGKPKSLRALFDEEGTFTLSGPDNRAPCGFAVTASSSAAGALDQSGRCAAPWKGRGWRRWSYAAGKLLLKDRRDGVILALSRADDFTFSADTPGGPVFFGPGAIDGSEMLEAHPKE